MRLALLLLLTIPLPAQFYELMDFTYQQRDAIENNNRAYLNAPDKPSAERHSALVRSNVALLSDVQRGRLAAVDTQRRLCALALQAEQQFLLQAPEHRWTFPHKVSFSATLSEHMELSDTQVVQLTAYRDALNNWEQTAAESYVERSPLFPEIFARKTALVQTNRARLSLAQLLRLQILSDAIRAIPIVRQAKCLALLSAPPPTWKDVDLGLGRDGFPTDSIYGDGVLTCVSYTPTSPTPD